MTLLSYHPLAERARQVRRRLLPRVERDRRPLADLCVADGPRECLAPHTAWRAVQPGITRHPRFSAACLRGRFTVPADWPAGASLAVSVELAPEDPGFRFEALAWLDGHALVGINPMHPRALLPAAVHDAQPHELLLDGWTGVRALWNGADGGGDVGGGDGDGHIVLGGVHLSWLDPALQSLCTALATVADALLASSPQAPAHHQVAARLAQALAALDEREQDPAGFADAAARALALLNQPHAGDAAPAAATVHAVGHGHLDLAWLWTLAETPRKAERTFFIALDLLRRHAGYHFLQSQPLLYEQVLQRHPQIEGELRQRIAEGRWEATGGMYVEPDTNMPSGESLVRQLVLGRRSLRRLAGERESRVLWLPDTFGFSWALPQLMALAGLRWMFTIKPSWNEINRLPADTFWWRGVDGTRVLVHVGTTPYPTSSGDLRVNNYSAQMTAAELRDTVAGGQDPSQADFLMAYGHGDGGGGPTPEMLDAADTLQSLPGLPRLHLSRADDFFRRIEAERGGALTTWDDEIYAEFHRGVLTTQGRTKRAHRRAEAVLHLAEWLSALAGELEPDFPYPHAALLQAWKRLCTVQFHDILPGSSIGEVYDDALRDLGSVIADADGLAAAAQAVIVAHWGDVVVNAAPYGRCDLARDHAGDSASDSTSDPASDPAADRWLAAPTAAGWPAHALVPIACARAQPPADDGGLAITARQVANRFLCAVFGDDGNLLRLFDKVRGRDALAAGEAANVFQAFADRPLYCDAWDIDDPHGQPFETCDPAAQFEIAEQGPWRVVLRITRHLRGSVITQCVTLTHDDARLDFETRVDWHERHTLLKVAFPLAVLAREALYEIQWAHIARPTHRNTSWDRARYEGPLQRWVDLSEPGFGVALLNDGRHGADVNGHVMRLSLLRGPTFPDPQADQGEHHFTYSLLCHDGVAPAHANAHASALNLPLRVCRAAGAAPARTPLRAPLAFLALDVAHAEVATVKRADDDGALVVRVVERQGRRGPVTLSAFRPIAAAWVTDLLEESPAPARVDNGRAQLELGPFQVLTLRLVLQAPEGRRRAG